MKLYVGAIVIPSIIIHAEVINGYTYAPDHCLLEKKGNCSRSHMYMNVKDWFWVILKLCSIQFKFPIFSTFIFVCWKSLIQKIYC